MNKEMNKAKSKAGRYLIIAASVLIVLVLLAIHSCTIRTPEIHGVVLDAETKKPVAEAWIGATIGTKTLTIQGDVGGLITLDPPHLRSGEDGTFVIPSRKIKKTPFPLAFGTEVDNLSVVASTLDKSGGTRPTKSNGFWNRTIEVTIYLEDNEKRHKEKYPNATPERLEELREIDEFSTLQALYRYCRSGRFSIESYVERPEGCDDWELDFAIKKHERFIESLGTPDPKSDSGGHYTGTLKQLGYLLKKRGKYRDALETFRKLQQFSEKRGTESLYKYEFDVVMPELQQLLHE